MYGNKKEHLFLNGTIKKYLVPSDTKKEHLVPSGIKEKTAGTYQEEISGTKLYQEGTSGNVANNGNHLYFTLPHESTKVAGQ